MISIDFLENAGRQQKIDQATILREYFQIVFLKYFFQLNPPAYFKGGTAIRLLFNSFRYSEDLDFTCTLKTDYKKNITDILPKIENETGTKIKLKQEKNLDEVGTRFRLIFQPNPMIKQPLGIKIDLSFREKPLDPQTSILSSTFPVSPLPIIKHYSQTEILSEKIRAIFTRNKPRDLFDLWFLLKQDTPVNWNFVIEKMKYYPDVPYSREKIIKTVDKYNQKKFIQDLNQFLPQNYREIYPIVIRETVKLLEKQLSFVTEE